MRICVFVIMYLIAEHFKMPLTSSYLIASLTVCAIQDLKEILR